VDVFNVAIDQQVIELEDRFSSQATELLSLRGSLDLGTEEFDIENTCSLVEKYYPTNFSSQEKSPIRKPTPTF
jgi:hypothetical protein